VEEGPGGGGGDGESATDTTESDRHDAAGSEEAEAGAEKGSTRRRRAPKVAAGEAPAATKADNSAPAAELPAPEEPVALLEEHASSASGNGSGSAGAGAGSSGDPSLADLKLRLLAAVAPLDRGAAAARADLDRAEAAALALAAAAGPAAPTPAALDGRWRLLFSSAFASGSLGGARPGPPAGFGPFRLGAVQQDIYAAAGDLDNVVTLHARFSLAGLPGVAAEPPALTLRLRHDFSLLATTVTVEYKTTVAKATGGLGGWLSNLPEAATPRLPEALAARARGADFEILFLDGDLRVTRGDRGELRVYAREGPPGGGF
jgi:hypothetical protein